MCSPYEFNSLSTIYYPKVHSYNQGKLGSDGTIMVNTYPKGLPLMPSGINLVRQPYWVWV